MTGEEQAAGEYEPCILPIVFESLSMPAQVTQRKEETHQVQVILKSSSLGESRAHGGGEVAAGSAMIPGCT